MTKSDIIQRNNSFKLKNTIFGEANWGVYQSRRVIRIIITVR